MGNWMTVNIVGTCDAKDVPALASAIDPGRNYENLHCLSGGSGLCGIGDWAAEKMDRVGNVAERDYTPDCVAEVLREKLLPVAPSLNIKVHCGGEYESRDVVATVTCANGRVEVGPPEIATLPEIPQEQVQANFLAQLMRPRGI